VTDAHNSGLPGGVEKSAAILSDDPATLSARSNRKAFFEIAGKKSAARRHELSGKGL
jgi:hypothetical protein